ncbi:MAG TPA: GntR family transcriptional regulator [Bacillales bacterium]
MKQLTMSQPLYQQAYEEIKELILTGRISPGSRITVTKLAEHYQISRTPLREALRQLQKEGLLIQDNLGSTVVELNKKDFEELYFCRTILEKEIIQLVVKDISDEKLKRAEKILTETEELLIEEPLEEDKELELLKLNTKFHETLTDSCSNKLLIEMLGQVRNLLLLYRAKILKYSEYNKAIIEEHRDILNAIKGGDSKKAMEVIETHLKRDLVRGIKVFEDR